MTIPLRQSTTRIIRVGCFDSISDGLTPVTTVSLAAADQAEAMKAGGGASVDISGATWAAVSGCDGFYDLTISTSVSDTVGDLTIHIADASIYYPVWVRCTVLEERVFDELYASGAAGPLATTTIAEMAQGKPPNAPTAEQCLRYGYQEQVYGKMVVDTNTAFEKQIFGDNETTVLWKHSIADSSNIFTRGEAVTG